MTISDHHVFFTSSESEHVYSIENDEVCVHASMPNRKRIRSMTSTRDGTMYAVTQGDEVVKITLDGRVEVVHNISKDENGISYARIAVTEDGTMFLSSVCKLLRISPDGTKKTLHNSVGLIGEIGCLPDGSLYITDFFMLGGVELSRMTQDGEVTDTRTLKPSPLVVMHDGSLKYLPAEDGRSRCVCVFFLTQASLKNPPKQIRSRGNCWGTGYRYRGLRVGCTLPLAVQRKNRRNKTSAVRSRRRETQTAHPCQDLARLYSQKVIIKRNNIAQRGSLLFRR